MKLFTVIGARPQFIKAAAVCKALKEVGIQEKLLHTGQHFDQNMSDVFFDELGIPAPAFHLGVSGGSHGQMTGRMLEEIEKVVLTEKPDMLMVYGDTNSTLAGALVASKLLIPVVHVEAGLRSFNKKMPEEQNRILTDHISSLHFAPTELAVKNLASEGLTGPGVVFSGDVMFDASLFFASRAEKSSEILKKLGIEKGQYVLSTIHRAENTSDPVRLKNIFEGLRIVAESLDVVVPIHPRTRQALQSQGIVLEHPRLHWIDPVGYLDMIALEKNAAVIATDSGGVQKEAFFYGVPCVTIRDQTEWTELVEAGWNRLVTPTSAKTIADAILGSRGVQGKKTSPYGHGKAAQIISNEILKFFQAQNLK